MIAKKKQALEIAAKDYLINDLGCKEDEISDGIWEHGFVYRIAKPKSDFFLKEDATKYFEIIKQKWEIFVDRSSNNTIIDDSLKTLLSYVKKHWENITFEEWFKSFYSGQTLDIYNRTIYRF